MIAVAILAAGESRRMGSPKALLDYHGKPFAQQLADLTRRPAIGHLRLILGARAEEIRARLSIGDDSIVVNENWPRGQLSSIQAAIASLPPQATSGLMLCPVDHPLITAATIDGLVARFEAQPDRIVLPVFAGRRGHPVIFPARLYPELLAASPEIGARQVVWAHGAEVIEVPTADAGVVTNLDDPKTYRQAMKKL